MPHEVAPYLSRWLQLRHACECLQGSSPLPIVSVAEELSHHETDSGPGPTIRLASAQTRNKLVVPCAVDSHRQSEGGSAGWGAIRMGF